MSSLALSTAAFWTAVIAFSLYLTSGGAAGRPICGGSASTDMSLCLAFFNNDSSKLVTGPCTTPVVLLAPPSSPPGRYLARAVRPGPPLPSTRLDPAALLVPAGNCIGRAPSSTPHRLCPRTGRCPASRRFPPYPTGGHGVLRVWSIDVEARKASASVSASPISLRPAVISGRMTLPPTAPACRCIRLTSTLVTFKGSSAASASLKTCRPHPLAWPLPIARYSHLYHPSPF